MNTTLHRIHGHHYPAFERAYDCRKEGNVAFRQRLRRMQPDPILPSPDNALELAEEKRRRTKNSIIEYVRQHPGATLSDTVRDIDHPYCDFGTAYAIIADWLRNGKIEGVRAVRDGRYLRVWLVETTKNP